MSIPMERVHFVNSHGEGVLCVNQQGEGVLCVNPHVVRWLSEKSVTKRTKALKLYMSFI